MRDAADLDRTVGSNRSMLHSSSGETRGERAGLSRGERVVARAFATLERHRRRVSRRRLSLCLSVSLCLSLSRISWWTYPSILCTSLCLSLCRSVPLSVSLSVSLSVPLSVPLSDPLSVPLSVSVCLCLSLSVSLLLSLFSLSYIAVDSPFDANFFGIDDERISSNAPRSPAASSDAVLTSGDDAVSTWIYNYDLNMVII